MGLFRMDRLLQRGFAVSKVTVVGVFYIVWLGVALKEYGSA